MYRSRSVLDLVGTWYSSHRYHKLLPQSLYSSSSFNYTSVPELKSKKPLLKRHPDSKRSCVIAVTKRFMASSTEEGSTTNDSVPKEPTFKNKLAFERSPYLLQHASNPVEWYPWGEEAFEKAKKEDKMIFLSVGYSTCHWCHVMERESFESVDVANVMNEYFVNIKVDREERPDVDKIYMKFVQSTTGGGGWPMSVWLTPDLKPILGGTYFPPDERYYGQPGFKTILSHVARQWLENKDKVLEQGNRLLEIITQSMSLKQYSESGKEPPSLQCVATCLTQLANSYDSQFGGFDNAPKFPQPVNFNFLFRAYARSPDSEEGKRALEMALFTLKMMAKGGIRDHVAQGFHRYSTDQFWHVPHFEKMLYDQGQLAVSYLDAFQISNEEEFADVARDILQYVSNDLSDPSGGFYSAEDADSLPMHNASRKKEGAFCVWTVKEVREHLPHPVEDTNLSLADVFCKYYNVLELGNVDPYQDPHDELKMKNVLIVRKSMEECAQELNITVEMFNDALAKGRKILYDIRKQRPKPHLDDKFVASWNGLMISGFARAAQVLGDAKYADRAMEAARFIHKHMYNSETGKLLRSAYKGTDGTVAQILTPIPGVLEDYTFLIRGLLDLYDASYDTWCIDWASRLQTVQDSLFWDTVDGGYFNSVSTDALIVLRLKEDQDGAEPNPNSVAVTNLLRLAGMVEEPSFHDKANRILSLYSHRLLKLPLALPEMICGLMYYAVPTTQIIITGDKSSPDTQDLLQCVHHHFLPFKTLILADSHAMDFFKQKLLNLNLPEDCETATAYVCQGTSCSLPVTSATELEKILMENINKISD